jgi:hypothetical protein
VDGYVKRFQVLWCIRTVEEEESIDFMGGGGKKNEAGSFYP